MYSLGIDLGGTNIAVGVVDEQLNIVKKSSCPTLAKRSCEAIVADMVALSRKLCEETGFDITSVDGVGIACPGTVNPDTGIVEYANNIRFYDFPLTVLFSELSGVDKSKIKIGNDANLAAYGEAVAGAAIGTRSSVTITLGTGVGSGIIIDGKVLCGCAYGGAEFGHMVIVHNGKSCTCGRSGCFEAYCSATALVSATREKFLSSESPVMHEMCGGNVDKVGGKTAFAAMRKGDADAKEVVDEFLSYLACGIGNIVNIIQPDVLCIGGGVSNEGDNLLKPLIPLVAKEAYSKDGVLKTEIRIAKLGNDAGIIGAAAYAVAK